jgi:hypothetical protein
MLLKFGKSNHFKQNKKAFLFCKKLIFGNLYLSIFLKTTDSYDLGQNTKSKKTNLEHL